jgi:hypothetical protein
MLLADKQTRLRDWLRPEINSVVLHAWTGVVYYWGGVKDLEKKIRDLSGGRPVFTAAVGPFRPATLPCTAPHTPSPTSSAPDPLVGRPAPHVR